MTATVRQESVDHSRCVRAKVSLLDGRARNGLLAPGLSMKPVDE